MLKSTARIGILGGAFDPPTRAHIALAEFLIAKDVVDQIWLMPAYAHKYGKDMQSFEHRLTMCQLACGGLDRILVSDFERQISEISDGSSYDMLIELQKDFPEFDFYFVIGQDNADTLDGWKNWNYLVQNTRFIVLPRPMPMSQHLDWYLSPPHQILEDTPQMPISSTQVRQQLGTDPSHLLELLTPKVLDYILHQKIYL